MRIQVMSDLHLEFEHHNIEFNPVNTENVDVLVLAGDIQVGAKLWAWFSELLKTYPNVVYIPGNHEFYRQNYHKLVYGGGFDAFVDRVHQDALERRYEGTLHYIHNKVVTIGHTAFIGHTLWSDMNRYNPVTMVTLSNGMNDFRLIKVVVDGVYQKFTPGYAYVEHDKGVEFIRHQLTVEPLDGYKKVVVTHHSPTRETLDPEYVDDYHMNGGYASDLDLLVGEADLWIHGHIHHAHDKIVQGTRVVVNPRGYKKYAEATGFNPNKIIDL